MNQAAEFQVVYNFTAWETSAINFVKENPEYIAVEKTVYAENIVEYVETGPVSSVRYIYKDYFVKEDVYLFVCSIRQCLYGTESLSNRHDLNSAKTC